jgi:hypothetical protein
MIHSGNNISLIKIMGVVGGYNVEELVGKKRKCVRYLSDQLALTERDRHMCHISK